MRKFAPVLLISLLAGCDLLTTPKHPFDGRCGNTADICFSAPTPQNAVVKFGAQPVVIVDTLFWNVGLALAENSSVVREVEALPVSVGGVPGIVVLIEQRPYDGYTVVKLSVTASGNRFGASSIVISSKHDSKVKTTVNLNLTL